MYKGTAKPFLKWAGGKGQLLNEFNNLYPEKLKNGSIKTYIEPFIGGGAVLFDILQKFTVEKAVIIDLNKELINCYRCIKIGVNELINELNILKNAFLPLPPGDRKQLYLKIREKFNALNLSSGYNFVKAAYFIFLNRTCFNGLYRVNNKNEFNVPFGEYKNPLICDEDNLLLINKAFERVDIYYGDYSLSEQLAGKNTFIYYDPPYRPLIQNQSFVKYAKDGFNDNDQIQLAAFVNKMSPGCDFMLSNSDPKNYDANDDFFDDLYKGFDIQRIQAKRSINCHADKRGRITEILVRNYK